MICFVAVFLGCAKSEDVNRDESNSSYPELNLAYWGTDDEKLEIIEAEINQIVKEEIEATVNLMPLSASLSNYSNQVNRMLFGDDKLDILLVSPYMDLNKIVNELLPMDQLLKLHGQDITKALGKEVLDAVRFDGKLYALPGLRDFAEYNGLLLRQDILDDYKISVGSLQSFDDLEEVFDIIKANEPNIKLVSPQLGNQTMYRAMSNGTYDPLSDHIGVLPNYDNNFKLINLFESQDYQEYLNRIREWYLNGYFDYEVVKEDNSGLNYMRTGELFSYFSAMKPGIEDQESNLANTELVSVPLSEPILSSGVIMKFMVAITRKSEQPVLATQLLNLLYSNKEIINLIYYGLENEHYTKVDEQTISFPEGDRTQKDYYSFNSWILGNQFISYGWANMERNIWIEMERFNKKAKRSKALGFKFDVSPVEMEWIAVNNVISQYIPNLENGLLDPEEYLPLFKEELDAAGIDKVIDEKQRQFDMWLVDQNADNN